MATDETRASYWVQVKPYGEADNLFQAKVFTNEGTDTGASGMGMTREAAEAEAWAALGAFVRRTTAEGAPAADAVDTMAPPEDDAYRKGWKEAMEQENPPESNPKPETKSRKRK